MTDLSRGGVRNNSNRSASETAPGSHAQIFSYTRKELTL